MGIELDLVASNGPGDHPPLVELPRINPCFSLHLEVAPGIAGCVICDRPIQKGMTRLCVTFDTRSMVSRPRDGHPKESYYIHPGCITERMGAEIPRMGKDCWDCGDEVQGAGRNCFTVSRFAFGKLCDKCMLKTRWKTCSLCDVFHPGHMIESYEVPMNAPRGTTTPLMACPSCAKRFDLVSTHDAKVAQSKEEADRQELRRAFLKNRSQFIERHSSGIDDPEG